MLTGIAGTVVRAWDRCARFAHLSALRVSVGDGLAVGGQVGAAGSSGNATGPHLHYTRERCSDGVSLPSRFIEAGVPAEGTLVTSHEPVP